MIKQSTFDFLKALARNNNKVWFQENRVLYEAAKKDFEELVMASISRISAETDLGILTPKDCIFRINRDARFSHNKSPYKTNFGAIISRGGKKNMLASYYIHLQPGQSFIGGGLYMPQTRVLNKFRDYILQHPKKFLSIVEGKAFKKFYGEVDGESLKNCPRGYSSDLPLQDYLKLKSLTAIRFLSDQDFQSENLESLVLTGFKLLKPFNDLIVESQLYSDEG